MALTCRENKRKMLGLALNARLGLGWRKEMEGRTNELRMAEESSRGTCAHARFSLRRGRTGAVLGSVAVLGVKEIDLAHFRVGRAGDDVSSVRHKTAFGEVSSQLDRADQKKDADPSKSMEAIPRDWRGRVL